jgi:hypothetical protein
LEVGHQPELIAGLEVRVDVAQALGRHHPARRSLDANASAGMARARMVT